MLHGCFRWMVQACKWFEVVGGVVADALGTCSSPKFAALYIILVSLDAALQYTEDIVARFLIFALGHEKL
jgi:hypothetical protein